MKIVDKISFSKLSDPLRSKEQLRGMGPGYDRSLVSLQATDGFAWKSLIGPEAVFSTTGPQVDASGNLCAHNYIPNSEGVGGAPGVLPTGWRQLNPESLISIVGVGSGYVDVKVLGTATSSHALYFQPAVVASVVGQVWTSSVKIEILSGSPAANALFYLRERTGTELSQTLLTSGDLSITRTLSGASNTGLEAYLFFNNGVHDFTIRISKPQLSKSATKLPYVPTYGSPAFGPSITDKGLWAGGAWTNLAAVADAVLSTWDTKSEVTISGNKIIPSVKNTTHYISSANYAFVSGTLYHASVKLKADGYSWVRLAFHSAAFPASERAAYFNISTGAKGTVDTNVTANISGPDTDGYYLCSISKAANASATIIGLIVQPAIANVTAQFVGDGVSGVLAKEYMLVSGTSYQYPYAPPGITVPASSSTTGGNGTNTVLNDKMLAALGTGGIFTAVAAVYVGAGSAEFVNNFYANMLTPNASPSTLSMGLGSTGNIYPVYGFDGTTYLNGPSPWTVAWNRDEIHLKCVQTNAAGTQFRVGNRRYTSAMVPIDALSWGSWIAYDGSLGPLTHLRLALNGTIPLWFRLVSLASKSLSDIDILKQVRYVR